MIGQDGKGKEINPDVGRQLLQFVLAPKLAVIKAFFGNGIEPQELASSGSASNDVHDGTLGRFKDLCTSESSHDVILRRRTRPIPGKILVLDTVEIQRPRA
jgi:hypothetical protein